MITSVVIGIVTMAIVATVVVLVVRRSRVPDGVATFQRQIDALSPEARRPVVDRVQQLDEGSQQRSEPRPPTQPRVDRPSPPSTGATPPTAPPPPDEPAR